MTTETYNIYCDESCHLENDKQPIMALGAIWCAKSERMRLSKKIAALKKKYNANGELKWVKVSKSRESFYLELVDWFLGEKAISFRALVVLNKPFLDHGKFNQNSHDDFYYKMYFSLLNKLLSPENKYDIYLDIKDTRSRLKNRKLKDVLCNNVYDFTGSMIGDLKNIHSSESQLLQFTDLLLGAISYKLRGLSGNETKLKIIERLEKGLRFPLVSSTPLKERKFNIFLFSPQKCVSNSGGESE